MSRRHVPPTSRKSWPGLHDRRCRSLEGGWPSILCKGGIYSADAPEQRAVWQVVGTRVDIALANEWGDRPPRTRIVAIGAHRALDGETRRERQSGTEPHHE